MWVSLIYYIILTCEALTGVFGARLYEEPRYEVLARIDHRIEIRRYASRLAAQIELPQADRRGRNEAFRTLFAYIAGANSASGSVNARIAMTVPVALEQPMRIPMTVPVLISERGGGIRMQFFMPAKYDLHTAPKPRDQRVTLVPLQSATVAILRFSGSGSNCFEKQTELIAKLEGSKWRPIEPPYALFYDAPFTLPFFRRNEAAVTVAQIS
jgi:SOUL heme-binding protein